MKARHLVWFRRFSQAFFLLLFLLLLIGSRLPTDIYLEGSESDIRLNQPVTFFFDLDPLADDCADDGVYEFMYAGPPLPFTRAVGSPLNPMAIK